MNNVDDKYESEVSMKLIAELVDLDMPVNKIKVI
jgi:hypothetical protein